VFPPVVPVQPEIVSKVDLLIARSAEENIDAPLIDIFDEERLCEELLLIDPKRAQEVCR
jgi:hypothetical protein